MHNKSIIMNIGEREEYLVLVIKCETVKGHCKPASHPITLSLSIVRLALRTEYQSPLPPPLLSPFALLAFSAFPVICTCALRFRCKYVAPNARIPFLPARVIRS